MKKKMLILFVIILIILLVAIGIFIGNKNSNDNSNPTNNSEPTPTHSISEQLTEQEKSIFNSNFDIYVGQNISGKQIKQLITSVKYSNENSSIRQVTLTINGEESLDSSKIQISKMYSVSFEYDEKGLICKVIIEDN